MNRIGFSGDVNLLGQRGATTISSIATDDTPAISAKENIGSVIVHSKSKTATRTLSSSLQGVGGLVAVVRDGAAYFPRYDANGNVTEYVSESGAVVASYVYDAFGNALSATGPMAGAFSHRFSTKYFDPETGLSYYGYRFYSPLLGRWINRDPIGEEGGMNLYDFARNNPITLFDKDGCAYFAYRPLNAVRWIGVVGNFEDDLNNTVIGHENLFFEDGKFPDNLGYFKDGLHPDRDNRDYRTPHAVGFNDCIMRKAVARVRPLPYSLLGRDGRVKYNCQDWAEEVRLMYYAIINRWTYYPKSTTTIESRR